MLKFDHSPFLKKKTGRASGDLLRALISALSKHRCQLASRRYCAIAAIYRGVVHRIIIFGYCKNYRAHGAVLIIEQPAFTTRVQR